VEFRTITGLSNWYMTLPSIQEQRGFYRKTNAAGHLLGYFGNKALTQAEGDERRNTGS
jgi:hypothetical protein